MNSEANRDLSVADPAGSGRSTAVRPTELATLLFTDIVGSTALKQRLGDHAGWELIQQHHSLVRTTLGQFPSAREIEVAGDSFFLFFYTPSEAVLYALALQAALRRFNHGRQFLVRDRIGLHLGEVVLEEVGAGQYQVHGMQVDTCARVMSLAQGGQILMTRPVFDNARQSIRWEDPEGAARVRWLNHGRFELKGIDEPLEICEVRPVEAGALPAPVTSEKVRRLEAAEGEAVLGWRPAIGQEVPNTPWILEEKLGEGGFGEVWRARHPKLKDDRVFKFSYRADRVRSLKREVTLFRVLKEHVGEHPNIVRLHEVFLEEPPYYLEEEYVAGKDLKSWCTLQGGVEQVPLEVRLEIAAQAAEALQAAHDAGIIHRDVKPGNILISDRSDAHPGASAAQSQTGAPGKNWQLVVKLTDFGIGQVVSEACLAGITRAGFTETMLTPSSSSQTGTHLYMAPELLAGRPASTRSDIYSLGVVLFQFLTGDFSRPLPSDWADEISDPLIREDLKRCFVSKLEERFPGAAQLAQNLRSLPERRAALARQEAERLALERKAYFRGVALATAVGMLVLLGVSALAWTALHQSHRARDEAATSKRVSDFLVGLFRVSDPGEARGNTVTAREILDRGAKKVEQELTNEPLVQARLMDTMGSVYRSLGLLSEAQPLLEKALRIRRDLLGEDSLEYAQSLSTLANLLWDKADYATARPMFERALAIRQKVLGPDAPELAASCNNLGNLFLFQGDYAAARPLLERSLAIRQKKFGQTSPEAADSLNSLGALEYRLGNPTQAKARWEQALAIRERSLGAGHPLLAMTCNNLGLVYKDMGEYAKAKTFLQRTIGMQEKSLGLVHPNLASALQNLGDVLRELKETNQARVALQRALAIREKASGPNHPELSRVLFSLAELERESGNFETAEPLYQRALSIWEKAFGKDGPETGWYMAGLANLRRDQGRHSEAERLYKDALNCYDKNNALDTPAASVALYNMGLFYTASGRKTDAETCYRRSWAICDKAYGPNHPDTKRLRDLFQ